MNDGKDEVLERAKARVGSMLRGKYRLERVLGVGGMAVVYAAKHRNNAEFAIKMLHPELSLRADLRERFIREGYIANSVKHPGAVAVSDDDVAEDGAAFIVMEMLRGMPVDALCEKTDGGRLPPQAAIAIAFQLLDVLASAHTNGIVHRDIKPANIFVTFEGAVKVLDFGIARLRDAASSKDTATGMVMGTPAYMAPEQAQGLTSEIGPQTDVWAVGATIYSMLTAQPVHMGENSNQVFLQAATAHARPITSRVPYLPADIANVIDSALAFQKQNRWASAAAMRDALHAVYVANYGPLYDRALLADLLGAPAPDPAQVAAFAQVGAFAATPPPLSAPRAPSNSSPASFEQTGRSSSSDGGGVSPRGFTALDSVGAPPAPLGGTTPQPVATGARAALSRPLPNRRSFPMAMVGGVGLLLLAGGAGGAFLLRNPAATAAATAPSTPPPTASEDAHPARTETVPPPVSPVRVAPTEQAVIEPAPVVSAAPVATAAAPPALHSKPIATAAGAGHPAAVAVPAPAAPIPVATAQPAAALPARKADCEPNYYFDANGTKHFKRECFQQGAGGQ